MPIAIEALPREQWEAWVLEQGGNVGAAEEAAPAADAAGEDAAADADEA